MKTDYFGLESLIEDSMTAVTSQVNDHGPHYELYGAEAMWAQRDAEVMSMSLESFAQGLRFGEVMVKDFAARQGMENVNILSNENLKKSIASKAKQGVEILVKIWKKLIEAIQNMIRQAQVYISGPVFASQTKKFNKHAAEFQKKWKAGSQKELQLYPKSGGSDAASIMTDISDAASKVGARAEKLLSGPSAVSKAIGAITGSNKLNNVLKDTKISKHATENDSAKDIAMKAFYGQKEVKKDQRKISSVFSLKDFKELGDSSGQKTVKTALKSAQDVLKTARKGLAAAEKAMKKDGRKEEGNKAGLHAARGQIQGASGLLLATFNVYWGYRADLMKCFNAVIKTSEEK